MDLRRKTSLVVGHTGYGKGLWTAHEVENDERLLISNPFPDKVEFGAQRIVGFDNLLKFFKGNPTRYRVSYTPQMCVRPCCKGKRTEFVHLLELSWALKNHRLVIDEVAASRHLPRGKGTAPMQFIDMATMGRHREVSPILLAQRPYYLPIEIRSESDELVCFQLTEPADLDWVSGYPGARDHVDEIAALPRFHYLKFTKEPPAVVRGRIEI